MNYQSELEDEIRAKYLLFLEVYGKNYAKELAADLQSLVGSS